MPVFMIIVRSINAEVVTASSPNARLDEQISTLMTSTNRTIKVPVRSVSWP